VTSGGDVKSSSIIGRAIQYLIGCIAILVLLVLLVAYWPAALVIAAIGGIIWWSRKSPRGQVVNTMTSSDQLAGNTPLMTQQSSSMPTVTTSVPTPVVTIEYNINRSVSHSTMPGTNEAQWASYYEILEVANYRIEHPMTYWAAGKAGVAEASCIEKNLPVSKPIFEPIGTLGYWPRYRDMTPIQRGNYLHWLATGKQGQLQDIGYAFVYFYGLERRVLIDGKDIDLIIPEVVRLLHCYPESRSFNGYLSRFIAFAAVRTGLKSMTNEGFTLCFEQALLKSYPEDLLAVILCWFYLHNHPLPSRWAFEVARQDIRTTRSVVADRAPEQFMSLFVQKYLEQFGDGMMLKVSDRERLLGYHPASPSLLDLGYSSVALAPIRIPNVLGVQSQFKPIVQIWSECIEELRAYSRAVSKGADITTREAYEALPPALRKDIDHPDAPRWEEVVATHASENGFSLTPLAKLAEIHGFEQREKLTPTQSKALAQTAEDIGLAIVPDSRLTGRAYAWSDEVVLFRPEGSAAPKQENGYRAAACMLELGMVVAGADGKVDPEELDQIERFLDDQFRLSSDESRCLKAYGLLLSKKPPSISSLSKSLRAALTSDQRAMIGKYLVGVAAANGIIDRKEITSLKSIYKALGIDASLDALLTELRQSDSQPVEVQTGRREAHAGEAIPPRESLPIDKSIDITINVDALKRIMAETAEVSHILGQALCETESEMEVSDFVVKENAPAIPAVITSAIDSNLPFSNEQLVTLDKRYHVPLAEILKEQAWSSEDLTQLAKRHQFMRSGMLDTINSWAYETLGDEILVEDDNMYKVNQSLVEV
jgi:uncharacterized tellurite resistance protein B-like protein